MARLGFLGTGDTSVATDTSSDGSVTVGASNSLPGSTNLQAFKHTDIGGITGLGFLGSGDISIAHNVSPDGMITVGASNSVPGGPMQAFRHVEGVGMIGLGFLPGDSKSMAQDATADGTVIVGASIDDDSNGEAFIWREGIGMMSLQDVLINEFGLGSKLFGWNLLIATSISNHGISIGGGGVHPIGIIEGFVVALNIPPFQDGVVGGQIIPIETTSLLLTSAQSFSWMIPVVFSGIGIGLFVVSRKSE